MAKAYVNKRDKFLWDNSFKPESTNEVPVPSVSDEGKAIVVNENGSYVLGDVSTEDEIVYFKIDAQGENLIDCTMAQIKAALDDGSKTVCLMRINGTTKFILPLFVYVPLTNSVNYAEFTNCKPGTYISKRRINYQTVKLDFANNTIDFTEESYYLGQDYSTIEQVVGTWIDGKPLYQKMFILDSDVNISNSSWTSISLYGSNIKLIIEAKCLSSGFALYPLNAYVDRADFKFMSCRDGNPATCKYLMLQYTKTTD